jgi:hypothetical protein
LLNNFANKNENTAMTDKRTKEQTIDHIVNSLTCYNFGDILKSRERPILIASFILCACFIDQLSQYRYGTKVKNGPKFVQFIKEYFDVRYHSLAQRLYGSLRCTLLHNYSTNSTFTLSDGLRDRHLTPYNPEQGTLLNIDEFIKDIKAAFESYVNHLRKDNAVSEIAIARQDEFPIIAHLE